MYVSRRAWDEVAVELPHENAPLGLLRAVAGVVGIGDEVDQRSLELPVALVGVLAQGGVAERERGGGGLLDQGLGVGRRLDQAARDQRGEHGAGLTRGVAGQKLALGPEVAGAEVHHGLDHVHRRGIGRGLGPAGLADDHVDLGEPAEDHVARLEVVDRLGHRGPGHGDRHVHHHPLVERA